MAILGGAGYPEGRLSLWETSLQRPADSWLVAAACAGKAILLDGIAMGARGLTFTFRDPDGRVFRLRPGASLVLGRTGHGGDIEFPDLALSKRHARLVHSGDTCSVEILGARGRVFVNERSVPRDGSVLQAADVIGFLQHVYLIVGVETADPPADA